MTRQLQLVLAIGIVCLGTGCTSRRQTRIEPAPVFRDEAGARGVSFTHRHGGTGAHYMPETMGSGCAFLDYNRDGWPDLLLLQAAPLDARGPGHSFGNRLFENDGTGRFREVPQAGGLADAGYAMGCAAADTRNNGSLDVLITRFGGVSFFRTAGGRFRNETREAGLDRVSGWIASAAFGDFDRDGYVDLFLCGYVRYSPATSPGCQAPGGAPGYCPPEVYPATRCYLFHNRGDGTFTDVSSRSRIDSVGTRALGVAFVDYDADGYPDIFVACDQSPNVLWHNRHDGTFENVAVKLGVAFDDRGQIMNGMGVDFADADHDGDPDAVVANFAGQPNSYFENESGKMFTFRSTESGLGGPSVRLLGFGCNFLDYDGDGWDDVFVANGHVDDHIDGQIPGVSYAEPASLYRNQGNGTFREVTGPAGQSLWRPRVRRGSAVADFDGDGAVDVLTTSCGDQAELFRNQSPHTGHWLTVRLVGTRSNRDGIGARVRVTTGATTQTREVRAGSSYLSQSDLALTFGLAAASQVDRLEVTWPSGARSVLSHVAAGRVLQVREPAGDR